MEHEHTIEVIDARLSAGPRVMGTRSGDLDPSAVDSIAAKEGLSTREVESLLSKQSGLLGISGIEVFSFGVKDAFFLL